jgi:N-acyl-phosphatidylethanolamine-hydrolysing phospholipase D
MGLISLDAVEGTRVVEVINPGTVIPMHHSTFSFYVEPISGFATRLCTSGFAGNLVVLREGDSWTGD